MFFSSVLAVLALGLGATTAMFSLVQTLLLGPLPYPQPERLVMIWETRPGDDSLPISLMDFIDWEARAKSFERLASAHEWMFSVGSPGRPPRGIPGAQVSGDFFNLLGVEPLKGRLFGPDDDRVGAPRVVVIGATVWRELFGADPDLVGRSVSIDGGSFTVVGIAPDGFSFSFPHNEPVDAWVPMAVGFPGYAELATSGRDGHGVYAMGRLAPHVTLGEAQLELTQMGRDARADDPIGAASLELRLVDLHEEIVHDRRTALWLRCLGVGLVFTLVCVNVASLLLARASTRRAEFAARLALGATRGRLIQQLVTETTLLFLLAAPVAALVAHGLVGSFFHASITGAQDPLARVVVAVDGAALLFCLAVSLGAGLLAALVPALSAARVNLQAGLEESGSAAPRDRVQGSLREAMVVAQVAAAFTLLNAGGLALDAIGKLRSSPLGFEPRGLISVRFLVGAHFHSELPYGEMLERIAHARHVEAVAGSDVLPYSGGTPVASPVETEGQPSAASVEPVLAVRNVVTPGYLQTLRMALLAGRDFSADDGPTSAQVMIISQSLAARIFPGQNPLGRALRQPLLDEFARTVVGVVGDRRRNGLSWPVVDESYTPVAQASPRPLVFAVRSARVAETLNDLPNIVTAIRSDLGVWVRRTEDRLEYGIQDSVRLTQLLQAFALVALFVSMLGLYALVTHVALGKTHEFGIRRALGTPDLRVAFRVVGVGLRPVAFGLALGLCGALASAEALSAQIPGVNAVDLEILGWVAAALGVTGLLACCLPASRILRMPPATALRVE
jgi:putative ABC transport system permease protein